MGPGLTRRQRLVRSVLFSAFALSLVWGTLWGRDPHFPFGPFSMYSGVPGDDFYRLEIRGVTTSGDAIELGASAFGLRRAEFDRQRNRFQTDPDLMEAVVASYENLRPAGPELAELEIVFEVYELIDGRPVFKENRTLATWQR